MDKRTKQKLTALIAVISIIACALPVVHLSYGQDSPPPKKTAEADIETLIKQLSDPDFLTREVASKALEMAGASAVPALVDLAVAGDAEGKHRAMQILRKLSSASGDSTVEALNGIARTGSGAMVNLAESMLKLSNASRSGEIPLGDFVIPGMSVEEVDGGLVIRSAGGQKMEMRHNGKGGGSSRMIMKTDGNTVITGSSDSGKATIVIDPEGVIRMTHSSDNGGELVTRAYQYRNEDELKTKNPDLHKVFRQFQGGGVRILGGARIEAVGGVEVRRLMLGDRVRKLELRVEEAKVPPKLIEVEKGER